MASAKKAAPKKAARKAAPKKAAPRKATNKGHSSSGEIYYISKPKISSQTSSDNNEKKK